VLLFENEKPAGRVDISRKENTFDALTEGVASFTILLSPDRVDFSRPVKVVVNGRTVFDSRVQRNIETLLKWTSRDNDRTMLFGAELSIRVP
jgi:hypothetical protein